ncbi:MAG: DUF2111 domain-containing protein [Methanosarcinaceae archaeon]|nr:DUF2111 domain-containing protein [Methanosarcinaceae archaeon]MDD4497593.1 DUF2111 domain-containing protein [Methanosarcinaceae archaeon]
MRTISSIILSEASGPEDLEPIALAVHALTSLPTTIRSLKQKGLRLENGVILERGYTGPILEEALKTNRIVRKVPQEGVYKGKPVVVAPIRSKDGKVFAAIGIVDLVTSLDLSDVFRGYPDVIEEVEEAKKRMK